MTQKELLYVEDAIGHEQNIIKIINESLSIKHQANTYDEMTKYNWYTVNNVGSGTIKKTYNQCMGK